MVSCKELSRYELPQLLCMPYTYAMERLVDKGLIFVCCVLALASGSNMPSMVQIALILIAIAVSMMCELSILLALWCPLAYGVLACIFPEATLFLPLIVYDEMRLALGGKYASCTVFAVVAVVALLHAQLNLQQTIALGCGVIISVILSWRTTAQLQDRRHNHEVRDKLQAKSYTLAEQNRDLRDKQDYDIEVATLSERARIAREIHDSVGHLLTRATLQIEALSVVHADEPRVQADFADVAQTVREALDQVRTSVHDLRDDAIDVSVQLEGIAHASHIPMQLDVQVEHVPIDVATCVIAIVREALSNVMHHSNATSVEITFREHPALYQLVITDNGTHAPHGDVDPQLRGDGMGLQSMSERVQVLGGTLRASGSARGFRVFASLPKRAFTTLMHPDEQ